MQSGGMEAACSGKQSFPSRTSAISTLQRMRTGNRSAALAYRCNWCSQYHIGHEESVGDRGARRWKRGKPRVGRNKRSVPLY